MTKLNEAPDIELHIHTNEDLLMTFAWWDDDEQTVPLDVASVEGTVVADDDITETNLGTLADIARYVSHHQTNGNGNGATATSSAQHRGASAPRQERPGL